MASLCGGPAATEPSRAAADLPAAATAGPGAPAQGRQSRRAGGTRLNPTHHVSERSCRRLQGQRGPGRLHGEQCLHVTYVDLFDEVAKNYSRKRAGTPFGAAPWCVMCVCVDVCVCCVGTYPGLINASPQPSPPYFREAFHAQCKLLRRNVSRRCRHGGCEGDFLPT